MVLVPFHLNLRAVALNKHHGRSVTLAAPHVTCDTLAPTVPYLTEHEKRCDTIDDEQWRVLRLNNHDVSSSLGSSLVATQASISHHVRQWREKHELFFLCSFGSVGERYLTRSGR